MQRPMRTVLVALIAAAASMAASPGGVSLDDVDPVLESWLRARQRTADQATHPEYLAMSSSLVQDCIHDGDDFCLFVDPYRVDWDGRSGTHEPRGEVTAVSFAAPSGVELQGHLWTPKFPWTDPVTGKISRGPFPGVVMVNAAGSGEQMYWGIAQSMAESGYQVLTFDPECQGRSGCSGTPPPDLQQEAAHGAYLGGCLVTRCDQAYLTAWYERIQSPFVSGALAGADWLRSQANPHRERLDDRRLAMMGHSAGGYGAVLAGHDPERRFSAIVAFDAHGGLPDDLIPSVPTMFQRSEMQEIGPHYDAPDPDTENQTRNAQRFIAAGVPTAHLALGGSTHQEWGYTPYWGLAFAGTATASSHGERVAVYYALAWLDRYLQEGRRAHDGVQRLTAKVFDASADLTSIGQGTWDPTHGNVPYTIAGSPVAEHLSLFHPSYLETTDAVCPDLRVGCLEPRGRG